jgi:hypothetical protein
MPIPACEQRQLALSIRLIEKTPVAVLRHMSGGLCRQFAIPVTVRVLPSAGAPNGELFGPEGALNGLFGSGGEERVAFRYWPTCAEKGPFHALVRAGNYYTAKRLIPVEPGCFPAVQRRIVHLGRGQARRSLAVQALNPGRHGLVVRAVLPHEARVEITIEDPRSGPTVHVLDEARRGDWCHTRETLDVCVLDFGALEAQSPCTWIVHVRKRTRKPAAVRIALRFEALR